MDEQLDKHIRYLVMTNPDGSRRAILCVLDMRDGHPLIVDAWPGTPEIQEWIGDPMWAATERGAVEALGPDRVAIHCLLCQQETGAGRR